MKLTPASSGSVSWYLTEYNPIEQIAFCYVQGLQEDELGYVSLIELERIQRHFVQTIERDLCGILVIEDHQDIAENIEDYPEVHGHIVDFAMDGISGMDLALTHDFEVIVLHLMILGMDGITLCKRFREEADK